MRADANQKIVCDTNLIELEGVVKWYDPAKGFGFVTPSAVSCHEIETDILLHKSILKAYWYNDADEFATIRALATYTEKGWQIIEIINIAPPVVHQLQVTNTLADKTEQVSVQWFDSDLGYGFVRLADSEEDIFLHIVTLKNAGIDAVEPEQSLQAVIVEGRKGRHVKIII